MCSIRMRFESVGKRLCTTDGYTTPIRAAPPTEYPNISQFGLHLNLDNDITPIPQTLGYSGRLYLLDLNSRTCITDYLTLHHDPPHSQDPNG